jgi:hypothetical protein
MTKGRHLRHARAGLDYRQARREAPENVPARDRDGSGTEWVRITPAGENLLRQRTDLPRSPSAASIAIGVMACTGEGDAAVTQLG